eukprot:COSAG02_NODE_41391_length_395_cov_0.716216_1_plen_49_part_10
MQTIVALSLAVQVQSPAVSPASSHSLSLKAILHAASWSMAVHELLTDTQ